MVHTINEAQQSPHCQPIINGVKLIQYGALANLFIISHVTTGAALE